MEFARANLDFDPAEELIVTVRGFTGAEKGNLYVVLDAQEGGYAATAFIECIASPREDCHMRTEPIHDGRFSHLWIFGAVTTQPVQQTFVRVDVFTLQRGGLENVFHGEAHGVNEVAAFRIAEQPAAAPRILEQVRGGNRVKKRFAWNAKAFKYAASR